MEQNQINLLNLDRMLESLAQDHWATANDIFPSEFCRMLVQECHRLHHQGELTKASMGPAGNKITNSEIRSDFTLWLEETTASESQKSFLCQMELLKQKLNQFFYLGLKGFESHFALYPPGGGYDKHIDNHRGSGARRITFVLYLNSDWKKGDGGEFSLYEPQNENQLITQIEPRLGTFVLFRSELFPHQVEKSHSHRLSLTGWFRNDAS